MNITEAQVINFCKKKKWKIVKNFEGNCSCEVFSDPALIIGYGGDESLACTNCADKCPRCKNFSSCIDYSSTNIDEKYGSVCYGCATGDNYSEESKKRYVAKVSLEFTSKGNNKVKREETFSFEEDEYASIDTLQDTVIEHYTEKYELDDIHDKSFNITFK